MYWDADVDLRHVTLSENEALGGDAPAGEGGSAMGGGVYHQRAMPIVHHLTAVDNVARGGAGSVADGEAVAGGLCLNCSQNPVNPITFDNNLMTGNRIQEGNGPLIDSDCEGGTGVASTGFNIAEAPGSCDFSGPSDQVGVDPLVLPVTEEGCTTMLPDGSCVPVYPFSPSSPALDSGSCTASGATEDARGPTRPFDDPAIPNVDDGCDIGAYELGPMILFEGGFGSGDTSAWALTFP